MDSRDQTIETLRAIVAEQAQVIDRRITQGTRSKAEQRYQERMWMMIATCKKQNRKMFAFLQDSIVAHLSGKPTPGLLSQIKRQPTPITCPS